MKLNGHQRRALRLVCHKIYTYEGQHAVEEYVSDWDKEGEYTSWQYCDACENDEPTLPPLNFGEDFECLVCGSGIPFS